MAGYILRQFKKAVTHPSTNRARCRATALIETNALPLHQTANKYEQFAEGTRNVRILNLFLNFTFYQSVGVTFVSVFEGWTVTTCSTQLRRLAATSCQARDESSESTVWRTTRKLRLWAVCHFSVDKWRPPWQNRICWYISFFCPSLNRVLFPMFCLLVEGGVSDFSVLKYN